MFLSDAGEELTDDDLNSMGVKAIDDYTLEVKTTVRVSFFDELMAFPCFFPINEKFCEKQGDKYGKSAKAILGNGAFIMTNWEPGSIAFFEIVMRTFNKPISIRRPPYGNRIKVNEA